VFACGWLRGRGAAGAREEAIRAACHELRGPLTAVGFGVAVLARAGSTDGGRVRAIELELGRAALALDDLAGCAAPLARSVDHAHAPVDLGVLLVDSATAWRPVAGDRELRLELPAGFSAHVLGSRFRLAQATGNLIANAIEHGGGEIKIQTRVTDGHVRVEVADGGPGLPSTVAQLTRRRRRHRRVVRGRGLAIASSIATAHGGRLFSAPASSGASVVLELPLSEAADAVRTGRDMDRARAGRDIDG
jgi:signal transduction histidine kinase